MADITKRYSFRGLLATLQPEVYFGSAGDPPEFSLTCFVTVPHRTAGTPWSAYLHHTWPNEPHQDELDRKVRELFKRLLAHEVDESFGVAGIYEDAHATTAPAASEGGAAAGSTPVRLTPTTAPSDAAREP